MRALRVRAERHGEVLVLRVSGSLVGIEKELRRTVQDALDQGTRGVALDVEDLSFVNSSGIGELVTLYSMVAKDGGSVVLVNIPTSIGDILQITQLITVFESFDSIEAAVAALKERTIERKV